MHTKCPNCGCSIFQEHWIKIFSKGNKNEEISLNKYALKKVEDKKELLIGMSSSGTRILDFTGWEEKLGDFIQYVLICEGCGYTKVIDIQKYRVADAI